MIDSTALYLTMDFSQLICVHHLNQSIGVIPPQSPNYTPYPIKPRFSMQFNFFFLQDSGRNGPEQFEQRPGDLSSNTFEELKQFLRLRWYGALVHHPYIKTKQVTPCPSIRILIQ